MVFGHHNIKLDEIKSNIKQAKYNEAKNNIAKHIKNELHGKSILNDLRGYVNEYEKVLQEIQFVVNELTDDTTPGRMARRDQCAAKVEVARSQLIAIQELIVATAKEFKE